MNILIPFIKELKFSNPVYEITKITLEHDYTVNDENILGNFYLSGEYKTSLVSVNTIEFKETLPFSVEIPNNIIKDSINIEIDDFTYEIIDNIILKVSINYMVNANIIDDTLIKKVEVDLEDELNRLDKEVENNIIDSIGTFEEEYIKYHIHIIKENENIESILNMYKINKFDLSNLNNLEDLSIGDKLIIPNESI